MKIVAGLGCIDDYIRFVKVGVDEFFCGYVPYEWTKRYGVSLPLNRREVLNYHVQVGSQEELRILRKMVERYQVPVKITFNSLYYLPEQYPLILNILRECIEIGFDTFIIADLALLRVIEKESLPCKVHISGEVGEVNHRLIRTLTESKITRYIFHRKNSLEDMHSCIELNQREIQEFEAFALNEWCHYTGGFCNSLHCDELIHLCKVPYELRPIDEKARKQFEKILDLQPKEISRGCWEDCTSCEMDCEEEEYLVGATGCGLCALYRMKEIGVTHLKLVGRGNYPDDMEQDINALRRALQLVDACSDEAEYKMRMKLELFPHGCSQVCYYR